MLISAQRVAIIISKGKDTPLWIPQQTVKAQRMKVKCNTCNAYETDSAASAASTPVSLPRTANKAAKKTIALPTTSSCIASHLSKFNMNSNKEKYLALEFQWA